ncbi:hypothetical protein ACI8AF_18040 [Blastococcus sp. SYSU D00669]
MAADVEIEPQGEHEYLVHLTSGEEVSESWFDVSPDVLRELGVPPAQEAGLVQRTVEFLLQHQEVADFPQLVELEDVLAGYDGYRDAVRSR